MIIGKLLADDTSIPRVLDQLPDKAWDFGPVFIFAIVLLLGALAIIWYAIRRFDKHATKVVDVIEAHLKESETTQKQTQLTLAAMEVRLQTNICRLPNGTQSTADKR